MPSRMNVERRLPTLVASKAITRYQADFIESLGDDFNVESFAHPHLQTVREHTRVFLTGSARPGEPE